jgi:hypothetical protein
MQQRDYKVLLLFKRSLDELGLGRNIVRCRRISIRKVSSIYSIGYPRNSMQTRKSLLCRLLKASFDPLEGRWLGFYTGGNSVENSVCT